MEATCDSCGNTYDNSLSITYEGESYTFDSFECAINKLAPTCEACGVRIIGHGIRQNDAYFCCDHCASHT